MDRGLKTCRACGVAKTLPEFSPFQRAADGHHAYCKDCRRLQARQLRAGPSGDAIRARENELSRADRLAARRGVGRPR
jgi:hypothetical protein